MVSSANGRRDILTISGQYFDFIHPDKYVLNVFDIAHGLSQICRFAGQCSRFYSVAEHSVYVSRIVPPEHAMAGLFHDAAEAFIGDVSRPLKQLLHDYKVIEKRVEASLFRQLQIPYPLPACIKHADMRMLRLEQSVLMPPHDDEWASCAGVESPDIEIHAYEPQTAFRVLHESIACTSTCF